MLVIDGRLKTAQFSAVRAEMLTHVVLCGRDYPSAELDVLIIGGGNGAVLREVLSHNTVNKAVVVEQDAAIIETAQQYLGFADLFSDQRVECVIAPLTDFVASACANYQQYDIVLLDDYDSAQSWPDAFYQDFNRLLHHESVVVDSFPVLLNKDHEAVIPVAYAHLTIPEVIAAQGGFNHIERYYALDPLTAGGYKAFSLYCKGAHSYASPRTEYTGSHYNPALHSAAFALPTWLSDNARRKTQAIFNVSDQTTDSVWFEQTQGSDISQALTMQLVHCETSPFQQIEFYQHELFGRVFVLDGTVQGSHADECIYHEMAVHVPVLGRRRDNIRALIIGGGDGGIVRELLKHDAVSQIVMAEIDEQVVQSSNRYFGIQGNYDDARVELHIGDAADYVAQAARSGRQFEIIIVDATDSTEPSANLWNDAFFANLAQCLTADGVCLDSDILIAGKTTMLSRDLHGEGLRDIKRARQFFAGVESYCSKIPLFPGGYFAFFLYTKDAYSYAAPYREYGGVHYNADLHRGCFALPGWWRQLIVN